MQTLMMLSDRTMQKGAQGDGKGHAAQAGPAPVWMLEQGLGRTCQQAEVLLVNSAK
jgi:hypothetical protein